MEPTAKMLIGELPPYKNEWVLIHPNQQVHDIIREVLEAHREFAPYYEKIALYFDAGTVDEICERLFRFCKKYLRYREESEDEQSTAIPTGLLIRGYCDCKGYAGFCGGVLDAINRITGKDIDWCYRFASYHMLQSTPHHVFIVVNDKDEELWIDPTPGSQVMSPIWQVNKKISGMPLMRNIAGFEQNAIGITSITVTPKTDGVGNLLFNGPTVEGAILKGMWPHYLGLSDYRDYSGDRAINEWAVAEQLNNIIAQNGGKHSVTGDFVKWVYNESIRSWNFFYPGGVEPDFDGKRWIDTYQTGMHQTGWPYLIITPDGRLTIDHDVEMDDYRNAGIHIMTAWAQSLVNKYDGSPYPVKPRHLKEFSQNYTGNPGNINANLFTEARGTSFLQDVGKFLEKTVNVLKDAVIKIVGIVPRNCFLALVGLNVFHMATDLANSIAAGHWDEIANKWKNLGGNPDKLKNTIEHGSGQPAIEDSNQTIDAGTVSGAAIGVVQVAALLAAAAPIIAALLKFLNKDGKLNGAILATETALQAAYPDADFSFLSGALTQGGKEVSFTTDPQYDENSPYYNPTASMFANISPWVVGGAAGVLSYLAIFKRQPKNKRMLYSGGIGAAAFFLWRMKQQHDALVKLLQLQQLAAQQAGTSPTSTWQDILQAAETGVTSYLQQQSGTTDTWAGMDYNQLNNDYATA